MPTFPKLPEAEQDELPRFRHWTLPLPAEDDGELVATLVSSRDAGELPRSRTPVLYVHGFVDYFFQDHLADAFEQQQFRFFALDLRRHGRSQRPGNRPCYATRIDDFFAELDWAIDVVGEGGPVTLLAHSTGGLLAAVYAARGRLAGRIERLILNSPFLRFPTSTSLLAFKLGVARRLGQIAPRLVVPQSLNGVYGKTIHQSEQGSFNYDLAKKPLLGFPFFAGWVTMICEAQREVSRGLNSSAPMLVMHSKRSHQAGLSPVAEDFCSDTVLCVADIVELAPRLGKQVTVEAVDGGLHDLTLSAPEVRARVLKRMVGFAEHRGPMLPRGGDLK